MGQPSRDSDDVVQKGLGLDEPERFLKAVEATTAERVREVAQKYLKNPAAVLITHQPVAEETLREAPQVPGAATQPGIE